MWSIEKSDWYPNKMRRYRQRNLKSWTNFQMQVALVTMNFYLNWSNDSDSVLANPIGIYLVGGW